MSAPHLIWIVATKEIVDNLRDRRSVGNALFTVLLNPLLFILLFGILGRTFSEKAEQALVLPVQGAENAPSLIGFLEQNNVEIEDAPAAAEAAVRAGEVDLVLIIPEGYGEAFTSGQPAPVTLLVDDTNQGASVSVSRARRLLERYSSQIGSLRLLARGISPSLVTPLLIQEEDVGVENEGAETLSLLPTVMLAAAFLGGYYLAADVTAGERERNSLEPLLVNPVPRWQIVMGKYIATFLFTLLATVLATLTYAGLLALPQLQSMIGLRVTLSAETIVVALLLVLPVVFMAVALELFIASFAKSFKEAQTYVTYLSLAGFMPAVFLSVLPIQTQTWMMLIPSISQTMLLRNLTRGEALAPGLVALATVLTLAVGVAALIATIRLYNRERIVLGGA